MKYTLLTVALAGLATALPQTVARCDELGGVQHPERNRKNATFEKYSSIWADAVQIDSGFTVVTGANTVPEAYDGRLNSAASTWVGIDGGTCQSAILQTCISFYGDCSFDA